MNVYSQHSIIDNNNQEQSSLAIFQPTSLFNNSTVKPDSLEDYDFETIPMSNNNNNNKSLDNNHHNAIATANEDEPIHHSSGLTQQSNVTNASTAPILHKQQVLTPPPPTPPPLPQQQQSSNNEEHNLDSIKGNSQDGSSMVEQDIYKKPPSPQQGQRPYRNYEVFPGNSRFLLDGRLVTSKDYRAFLAGLLLLVAPTVLFGVFTCPWLWKNVHPALPIIFAYLFILSIVNMLKAAWTEPGIIPRNLDPIYQEIIQSETASTAANGNIDYQPKEIQIKDTAYFLKYCDTCKIYRPPRASHCKQCDNCVECEDHHCAWLNNCVGKRNYRPFFTFITASALLCIFVICSVIYQLIHIAQQQQSKASFGFVFSQAPVSFVLSIYCFFLLWLVGGLTLYHCSLIIRGISTHEHLRADIIKARYPDLRPNPYSKKNPFINICHILCLPQPKSYLHRRKMADPPVVIKNN